MFILWWIENTGTRKYITKRKKFRQQKAFIYNYIRKWESVSDFPSSINEKNNSNESVHFEKDVFKI